MRKETKKRIRVISLFLFIFYLILLIYFLFFAENFGRVSGDREYAYNLELFKEIKRFWNYRKELGSLAVFTNIAGNIICFLPFGAILPVLNRRNASILRIALYTFEFSFLVECAQLISRVGSFDVDDILLNTAGGILGYLIYALCNAVRRKCYG